MPKTVDKKSISILDDSRILDRLRYRELVNVLWPACPDWNVIGPELVFRGWLTSYQLKEIREGRGNELFLDEYVFQDLLGQGGMGRVYKARHEKLNRTVSIKVIRQDRMNDAISTRRFLREIQALGRVSHPHIIQAFDAAWTGDWLYYVMEYVDGTDLGRYINEKGPLPISEACRFLAQICNALQHVHEQRMIHRDIKPSNLLRTKDGSSVKLLDLGLVRLNESNGTTEITRVGSILGTPDFISPEQAFEPLTADIRSDLYSLGCTFYFLLTGRAPFEGREIVKKLMAHDREDPVPMHHLRPDVPEELARIIHRMMAKKPIHRYREPMEAMYDLIPVLAQTQDENAIYWQTSDFNTPVTNRTSNTLTHTFAQLPNVLPETQIVSPEEFRVIIPIEKLPKKPELSWLIPFFAGFGVTFGAMLILLALRLSQIHHDVQPDRLPETPRAAVEVMTKPNL